MDKPGKTYGNIVSDTLTFMDFMGLSMAASDNPQFYLQTHGFVQVPQVRDGIVP